MLQRLPRRSKDTFHLLARQVDCTIGSARGEARFRRRSPLPGAGASDRWVVAWEKWLSWPRPATARAFVHSMRRRSCGRPNAALMHKALNRTRGLSPSELMDTLTQGVEGWVDAVTRDRRMPFASISIAVIKPLMPAGRKAELGRPPLVTPIPRGFEASCSPPICNR